MDKPWKAANLDNITEKTRSLVEVPRISTLPPSGISQHMPSNDCNIRPSITGIVEVTHREGLGECASHLTSDSFNIIP